ncbi:unnamed protein product [Cuscuta campestris]|uniref:Uncharacterized protein n=1 Tax=Cuscuta campestris TaxID=132261 RepID=A0A484LS58_9ASTE|nr:unnamed protein product [Cuscuta campestris]
MAPSAWTHEPSIIKEGELREMAGLLGKGFRVHHPDPVEGISLSHNPNPQKYMVMHYHSMENGFRLPLHGLLRDICRHFGFAPGQLTANAHNLFPHPQAPIFERVEFKHDKWSHYYFVIEFPVHSPLDLPGVVRRSSISRIKFAAVLLAEAAYNALGEEVSLIPHHSLQDARLYKKADFYYPLGPNPIPFEWVSSPERPEAPLPLWNLIQPGVPPGDRLKSALRRPAVQPQPEVNNTSPPAATISEGVEKEADRQKEPEASPATEKEVGVQEGLEASSSKEKEIGGQKDMEAPPETERETERQQEPEKQHCNALQTGLTVSQYFK